MTVSEKIRYWMFNPVRRGPDPDQVNEDRPPCCPCFGRPHCREWTGSQCLDLGPNPLTARVVVTVAGFVGRCSCLNGTWTLARTSQGIGNTHLPCEGPNNTGEACGPEVSQAFLLYSNGYGQNINNAVPDFPWLSAGFYMGEHPNPQIPPAGEPCILTMQGFCGDRRLDTFTGRQVFTARNGTWVWYPDQFGPDCSESSPIISMSRIDKYCTNCVDLGEDPTADSWDVTLATTGEVAMPPQITDCSLMDGTWNLPFLSKTAFAYRYYRTVEASGYDPGQIRLDMDYRNMIDTHCQLRIVYPTLQQAGFQPQEETYHFIYSELENVLTNGEAWPCLPMSVSIAKA